ncbi:Predicted arabinose efflux permease, MFS family [Methanolobus profundi]|uniref:Predicted arabinose efflux permease, MFS family n=2 Tax=Methanolobus profundi TaxID=487685 RepID=A0A1I4S0H1_9EURY|nr:Predicted arabinose efflux permease, MFS family [Methanolobus profundi]
MRSEPSVPGNSKKELDPALYVLSISKLFKDLGTGMLAFLLPLYIVGLDGGMFAATPIVVRAGIIATVFGLSNALSQPFLGRLSDSLNRRKPFVVIGMAGFTIISFIYANTDSFEYLVILRVLQGLTVGATVPAIVAMVTHLSTTSTRGVAIGIYSTVRGFGFGSGSILGGIIASYYGFVTAFYVCSFLGLASFILISFFVTETHDGTTGKKKTSEPGQGLQFFILSVAMFMMMFGIMIIFAFLPEYGTRLDTGEISLSIAVSAYVIIRVLFQAPMGLLSDRLGRKKIIILGLLLNIPIVIGLGYVMNVEQLIILRALQGISMAAVETPVMALAVDLAGISVSSKVSSITASQAAGMALGPIMGGLLAGYISFETPFYLCAVMLLVSLLLVMGGIKEPVSSKNS